MGRPNGVTHSTVCPDWAMSLALSVSQFFSRRKQGRKWLELVWASGRSHSLLAQATLTPALTVTVQRLRGVSPCTRHTPTPLGWDRRIFSGSGPRRTISPHVYVWVGQQEEKAERDKRQQTPYLDISSR